MEFVTANLWLNIIIFVIGVAILIKGSDWFIDAAAALARSFGVSELVIGLTLVSIGTSLPELASSLCASFYGQSNFIIGNIVGSNTANIALILGVGLILGGSISFPRKVVWRDMLLLLVLGVLLMVWYFLGVDMPQKYSFGRIGGIVLLLICAGYSILLCKGDSATDQAEDSGADGMSRWKAGGLIILSLAMIMSGAKCMVDTVVWSAVKLGVSALMISLTIVAVGTSLPELAVTVSGILKKRNDIALGNIIGSGIYNIVLIIGACSLVNPLTGSGKNSLSSMLIMNAVALVLFLFMLPGKKLYRWQGVIFLLAYVAFAAWSFLCVK